MFGHFGAGRFAVLAATFALLVPCAVAAQDIPSYARPAGAIGTDETIHGRIRSVDGAFRIAVDDDRGFVDTVELHAGTIINPTGLTLSEGMSVTILGVNAGSTFDANEIDTPYNYAGPLPTPVYYGPGYWYPGFGYGYGPSFNLIVAFGGGYRSWGFVQRPFYGRPWNGYGYFGGYVGVGPLAHGHAGAPQPPATFAGRTFAHNAPAAYAAADHFGDVETAHGASAASGGHPAAGSAPRAASGSRAHASSAGHSGGGGRGH
jgi:hypothetical protein